MDFRLAGERDREKIHAFRLGQSKLQQGSLACTQIALEDLLNLGGGDSSFLNRTPECRPVLYLLRK